MNHHHLPLMRRLIQVRLLLLGLLIVLMTAFVALLVSQLFYLMTYRVVAIFLLLILASHLLARIAQSYISI